MMPTPYGAGYNKRLYDYYAGLEDPTSPYGGGATDPNKPKPADAGLPAAVSALPGLENTPVGAVYARGPTTQFDPARDVLAGEVTGGALRYGAGDVGTAFDPLQSELARESTGGALDLADRAGVPNILTGSAMQELMNIIGGRGFLGEGSALSRLAEATNPLYLMQRGEIGSAARQPYAAMGESGGGVDQAVALAQRPLDLARQAYLGQAAFDLEGQRQNQLLSALGMAPQLQASLFGQQLAGQGALQNQTGLIADLVNQAFGRGVTGQQLASSGLGQIAGLGQADISNYFNQLGLGGGLASAAQSQFYYPQYAPSPFGQVSSGLGGLLGAFPNVFGSGDIFGGKRPTSTTGISGPVPTSTGGGFGTGYSPYTSFSPFSLGY